MDSQDDLDRVLKIFYAIDRYSIHEDLCLGKWMDSPLTFFVGYGGGLCEDRANVQRMLWDYLGHSWGVSWRATIRPMMWITATGVIHLDPDTQAYYLMHDNWTMGLFAGHL